MAKEEEEPKDKSSRAQSASDIDMDTGSANSESEPVSKGPSSPVEPRPEQQDTVISKEVQKTQKHPAVQQMLLKHTLHYISGHFK